MEVQILRELQARFSYVLHSRRLDVCNRRFAERDGKGRRALSYKVRAGVGSAEEKFDQWRSGGA
jgi:hypothetical protein